MTTITELADEVRMLGLEEKKIGLEKRIAQLKAEPIIDGDCIGCAGPCSDRIKERLKAEEGEVARLRFIITREHGEAAKLQEELDECVEINSELVDRNRRITIEIASLRDTVKNFKAIETRETDRLHKTVLDMDVTISDLMDNDKRINRFLDEYRLTVDNRDNTIEELKDKNIIEADRLRGVIDDKNVVIDRLYTTIDGLKDQNTKDLNELYELDKEELSSMKHNYEIILQNRRNGGDKLEDNIKGLEAELSARKHNSEVLEKVVELVKNWEDDMHWDRTVMKQIATIIKDYLDAPEGSPETPIDDLYKVTVTFAFLELP